MNDPFTEQEVVVERLLKEYGRHKNLIVALDFDHTIFDYHGQGHKYPAVIELIKECNKLNFPIVIFSGSAKDRYPFIRGYCESIGIEIKGINEDLVEWHPADFKDADWSNSKIFYNIFLDDRAGLGDAYRALKRVVDHVKSSTEVDNWNNSL